MKILVACELSGIVRDAFIAKGHNAISCDLLPTEKPGPHYQGNVMDILQDSFDMLIAFPPCTYLSYIGTRHWNRPGRLEKRLAALNFFAMLYSAPITKICIENPLGCASPTIAKYSQIIHPYFFGDPQHKRTCLWLKGLPKLVHSKQQTLFGDRTHTAKPAPLKIYSSGKVGNWVESTKKNDKTGKSHRSVTFPGIAAAMADQWG